MKFVKRSLAVVGSGAGALASSLTKQLFSKTLIGKAAMIGAAIVGGNTGYNISADVLKSNEVKIFNLKKERDRLKKLISERKKKFNE